MGDMGRVVDGGHTVWARGGQQRGPGPRPCSREGARGGMTDRHTRSIHCSKGAITSKIKHAVKHKASPARLAQLLQPSLAFCFSLQPMTAYRPVRYAVIG